MKNSNDLYTYKNMFLTVNDKWNNNTSYNVACNLLSYVDTKGNKFIDSLLDWFWNKERLSEKQAYCLAKWFVENVQIEKPKKEKSIFDGMTREEIYAYATEDELGF